MPVRDLKPEVPRQVAEDGNILDGGRETAEVALRCHPVEDDPCEGSTPPRAIEAPIPEALDHGSGTLCHAIAVHYKDDGKTQGIGEGSGGQLAVIEAHDPLDNGDVGIRSVSMETGTHVFFPAHPQIEVPRNPAGREPVKARIDEIGSGLERLDPEPLLREGCKEPQGDRRLAAPAVCSR